MNDGQHTPNNDQKQGSGTIEFQTAKLEDGTEVKYQLMEDGALGFEEAGEFWVEWVVVLLDAELVCLVDEGLDFISNDALLLLDGADSLLPVSDLREQALELVLVFFLVEPRELAQVQGEQDLGVLRTEGQHRCREVILRHGLGEGDTETGDFLLGGQRLETFHDLPLEYLGEGHDVHPAALTVEVCEFSGGDTEQNGAALRSTR